MLGPGTKHIQLWMQDSFNSKIRARKRQKCDERHNRGRRGDLHRAQYMSMSCPHPYLRTSAPCLKEAETGRASSGYREAIAFLSFGISGKSFMLLTVGSDGFPLN